MSLVAWCHLLVILYRRTVWHGPEGWQVGKVTKMRTLSLCDILDHKIMIAHGHVMHWNHGSATQFHSTRSINTAMHVQNRSIATVILTLMMHPKKYKIIIVTKPNNTFLLTFVAVASKATPFFWWGPESSDAGDSPVVAWGVLLYERCCSEIQSPIIACLIEGLYKPFHCCTWGRVVRSSPNTSDDI